MATTLQSVFSSCSRSCYRSARRAIGLPLSFSSSSLVLNSRKTQASRMKRKESVNKREIKQRLLADTKPDPILGHHPNTPDIWTRSELANLVLSKDQVWGVKEDRQGNLTTISNPISSPSEPLLNFGLNSPSTHQFLFQQVPQVMSKDRILDSPKLGSIIAGNATEEDLQDLDEDYTRVSEEENHNASVLARILDLRNASGKGIQVENIRRIINHFGNGVDTGSVEVQVAVLTYRIRNLAEHLSSSRKDNSNRRSLGKLVHQRARLLKYLKRNNPERYNNILPRIGVEARAVEGEIILPGKPKISHM